VVLEDSDLSERMKVTPIAFSLEMLNVLSTLLAALGSILRSRAALELENLALRHQIGVLRRLAKRRAKLTPLDRLFWAWLSHIWGDWRSALTIVQPETVIAWHRRSFGLFSAWKIRRGQPGRPTLAYEVRELVRRMCRENPTWGTVVPASPRITQFWSKVRTLWQSKEKGRLCRSRRPLQAKDRLRCLARCDGHWEFVAETNCCSRAMAMAYVYGR
jgi:hypothetical protein